MATGRLPGRLSVAAVPDDLPVAHATVGDGRVLIAARRDSRAWLSLSIGGEDTVASLVVDDVPPFAESPSLGRVTIHGRLTRLGDRELRAAGLLFAEANPIDDLLDLGCGVDLFRLILDEARLERGRITYRLTPEEFAAAAPDPLHPQERELLTDLREHHATELAALVPGAPPQIQPVRLDRYGLVVALPRLARLEFSRPAQGPCCVAQALRLNHA
jgi:hypothetical protein